MKSNRPIPKLDPRSPSLPKELPSKKAPPKPKQIVSVAGLFKQKPPALKHSILKRKASPAKKSSPNKKPNVPSIQRPKEHPVAAHFNETTHAYRTHLYAQATSLLDTTHGALLSNLSDLNTTILTPPPTDSDPNPTPIAVPIPTAIAEDTKMLTHPLGSATLRCKVKTEKGDTERMMITLERRLRIFEDMVTEAEEELKKLGREWESIVGEIVRIGIQILGEKDIRILLNLDTKTPKDGNHRKDNEDDNLFIPSDDELTLVDTLLPSKEKEKKKVSFAPESPAPFPDFVNQPSLFKKPLPLFPALPEQEIAEFEKYVEGLGIEELDELKRISKEEQRTWADKQRKIVKLLEQD